ncbi:MAG: hypothetical protein KIS66_00550 [Fimbriimonadaceae bacterium]|nr:hypothetical protein [Fimbriimonadaceae bacterium]
MTSEPLLPNPYGRFDPATSAFVVTDPRTPRPWVNVLANERYGLVLSQAGGGFSWLDNCQLLRLNRWEQDLVTDAYGRFLYVQDGDELYSTTFQPTRRLATIDEIEHGLGYTTFRRAYPELSLEQTVFVPIDGTCEVWIVTIENRTPEPKRLGLGTYLEWHLGGPGEWHREFHRLFMESEASGDALFAWKHAALPEGRREVVGGNIRAFLAVHGVGPVRWITDKSAFLGRIGTTARPEALWDHREASATPRWDDPVAGGLASLSLGPGETQTFTVVIGASDDPTSARTLAARFEVAEARASLDATRTAWRNRCGALSCETPDPAFDLMNNGWLPYQTIAGRLLAKCAYYQQGGAFGFRDQLQDSLALLPSEPETTLRQLGRHAEAMFEDGGVRHWWHPNTDIAVASHHSDTSVWLAHGLLAYLDETADLGSLAMSYRFVSRETNTPGTVGTLLEHALRGVRRALDRRSERGLPLIGGGDWNDGLSHVGIDGRGESVWLAMFLYDVLARWRPYLGELGLGDVEAEFDRAAQELRDAVHRHAWDGDWFIAGTRDDGAPFGSRSCRYGSIYLNPQTWAVISGIGDAERDRSAMASAKDRLVKPYGAVLLDPAYREVDPYIGYISRYAPALRENGGVYSHASTWAVQAFVMHGDPETAFAIYQGMNPALRAQADADLYAAEPYVMPGNADGPDSPYEGRAGWTWYTGSSAWMRRMAHEWILGVRAGRSGLHIQPSLPTAWTRARVRRAFRGDAYAIAFERTDADHGIWIDERRVAGPIQGPGDGATVRVDVRIPRG